MQHISSHFTTDDNLKLHDGVSSDDKTPKLYTELYHELVNKPERQMILQDTLDWLNGPTRP